jgi:uncharacterized protein (DUF433 family)
VAAETLTFGKQIDLLFFERPEIPLFRRLECMRNVAPVSDKIYRKKCFTQASDSEATMIDETLLGRITANPEIFGGKPIIRGMRISVELILSLLAQAETPETILADYPDLEPEDLRACLAYAHAVIAHDKLDSVHISR